MALTNFGINDPKTVKRFSVVLAAETLQKSWWGRGGFISTDGSNVIQRVTDLERGPGDQVTVDVFANLTGQGTKGSAELKGNEESLVAYTDSLWIDQLRHGVSLGSRMTRKRTAHDLRMIGKDLLSSWWARIYDEALFMYLTGVRGAETGDWLYPARTTAALDLSIVGTTAATKLYANNLVYPIAITRTESLTHDTVVLSDSNDVMSMKYLELLNYKLQTMSKPPKFMMVDGQETVHLIMHPYAEYQLRNSLTDNEWKNLQARVGNAKAVFGTALGRVGRIMLHSHPKIPLQYGGASGVAFCYNILVGAQAAFLAHGDAGAGLHFSWHEEVDDRGDKPVIDTTAVFGIQRARWNNLDYSTYLCPSYFGAAASITN